MCAGALPEQVIALPIALMFVLILGLFGVEQWLARWIGRARIVVASAGFFPVESRDVPPRPPLLGKLGASLRTALRHREQVEVWLAVSTAERALFILTTHRNVGSFGTYGVCLLEQQFSDMRSAVRRFLERGQAARGG